MALHLIILLKLLTHIVEDESVDIGLFLKHFCQRLATSVTSLGVDADEHRIVALMALLQGGCKLK